jgi:TPR repeat protein
VLYGAGQHLPFLEHMARVGRKGLSFGNDAEKDSVLAWMVTADWRDLPLPSSSAFRSSTWVRVLVSGTVDTGFTAQVAGFPSCTGSGASEPEALQAAGDALTAHLIAIIVAGTQMPSLFAKETPDLPGAREAHLTIKTPRPRRNALAAAQPRLTEMPGVNDLLSQQEQRKLDGDLMLTGTPLIEALHDRGCDAYTGRNGNPANPAKAATWFALAAAHGHTQARLVLGCLHRDGRGVPRDLARAIRYWEQTDHPLACYLLGLAYSDHRGIPRDLAKAGQWLRKAAAAGLPDATSRLLALLDGGRLTAIDADEPLHWLQQAAARGSRAAHDRVFPVTRDIMNSLFRLAMAAPALPSPMSEWRIVRLEDARPPEMPAKAFAGYLDVLYSTQYLQPDKTPGFAQVWIYELRDRPPLNLAEIGRRKPLH